MDNSPSSGTPADASSSTGAAAALNRRIVTDWVHPSEELQSTPQENRSALDTRLPSRKRRVLVRSVGPPGLDGRTTRARYRSWFSRDAAPSPTIPCDRVTS